LLSNLPEGSRDNPVRPAGHHGTLSISAWDIGRGESYMRLDEPGQEKNMKEEER
jgi:hypothetical protein